MKNFLYGILGLGLIALFFIQAHLVGEFVMEMMNKTSLSSNHLYLESGIIGFIIEILIVMVVVFTHGMGKDIRELVEKLWD